MRTTHHRPSGAAAGAAVLTAATSLAVLTTGPATAAPTTRSACATTWGSLDEASTSTADVRVLGARAGRHACFDRLVVDLGPASTRTVGYHVGYRSRFTDIAKGDTIPLRGAADLVVTVQAPAYTPEGRPTYRPANRLEAVRVSGFSTFRQIAFGGSFEGQTTFGVGTRARLPMRAFVVKDATRQRLVVDVAHTW